MKSAILLAAAAAIVAPAPALSAPATHHAKARATKPPKAEGAADKKSDSSQPAKELFKPSEVRSTGTVIVVVPRNNGGSLSENLRRAGITLPIIGTLGSDWYSSGKDDDGDGDDHGRRHH